MKQTKVNNLLAHAQALISDGWTQDTLARNRHGKMVSVSATGACRFCMLGALDRARIDLGYNWKTHAAAELKLAKVVHDKGWRSKIADINDAVTTKKEHVFDAFTLAMLGAP